MTFVLFKIGWALARPGTVIVLMLAAGTVMWWRGGGRWRAAGRALSLAGAGLLAGFWTLPLGSLVTAPLEAAVAADALPAEIAGIVILGGAVHAPLSRRHGQPAVNESAERLISGLALARAHPQALVIYSGGNPRVFGGEDTEAASARSIFESLGFAGPRFAFEAQSRNTRENALYSKDIARPGDGEAWVLVTSAAHMPRALGVFAAAGWPMLAHPVDYRTGGDTDPFADMNMAEELALFEYGVREWLALAAYRLRGWTGSFWPKGR